MSPVDDVLHELSLRALLGCLRPLLSSSSSDHPFRVPRVPSDLRLWSRFRPPDLPLLAAFPCGPSGPSGPSVPCGRDANIAQRARFGALTFRISVIVHMYDYFWFTGVSVDRHYVPLCRHLVARASAFDTSLVSFSCFFEWVGGLQNVRPSETHESLIN